MAETPASLVPPEAPEGIETPAPGEANAPRSRRALLAAAAAGAAGAAATALARPLPANAAAGDPLILGQDNFAGSSATRLFTTSSGGAFWMTQNGSGSGVRGDSPGGHGGVFTTEHNARNGLWAQQNAGSSGSGAAVRAAGNSNYGVYATNSATGGIATLSEATAVAADGSAEYTTRGVQGEAAGDGDVIVIIFIPFPIPSAGVYGYNGFEGSSASASAGVWAEAVGDDNQAMRALHYGAGQGIWASSVSGIGGEFTAANDFAVRANGDAYVTGDLTVDGTVSAPALVAEVDHPLAPASRLLRHAPVGSSERLNVYSGNVTTDGNGEATVRLPGWFEALNTDLRYQLTAIGAAAQAWVAAEVKGGEFTIATDKPNVKISWQITGARADAWAKANGFEPSVEKPAAQQGRYLHPELYGKAANKGIGYRPDPLMDAVKEHGPGKVKAAYRDLRASRRVEPAS